MTRHVLAFVLVTVLLFTSASASVLGEGDDTRLSGDDLDIIGNTTWTKDIRVTHNSADDGLPQIVVDPADVAHIIWKRSGLWTKTFDNRGHLITKDIFITPHVTTGYGNPARYPLGPQIAIDSESYHHVVWDDGYHDCYYQKFDEYANPYSSVIQLGADDEMASHVPSIAIDTLDENVHIVHEDYQYQCEDILYCKLDINGKALMSDVAVSSDVASHCENSILATDDMGNVHVLFGSPSGCYWRKVDRNGTLSGHTVRIEGPPAYMTAAVACTPNGDVHLAWTWNGSVRYTRMDNDGTLLDVNVSVSKGATDPGPPRIAAAHGENTVHIVWHDMRDGNGEIYYASMEEGSYGATPDNVRLTDDAASSLFPWVAVSPGDSVHVVWSDARDGNTEIYYKFMFNLGMDLEVVDLSELADAYFFHPYETKELHMYIKNLGLLPDDYRVTVEYDDWAEGDGWSFELNESRFDDVEGDASVYFHLTMTGPRYATPGDWVNVSVTATSTSGETDEISWRAFVIVDKSVSVTCADPTMIVSPGEEALFDLTVTNTGDVRDTYIVESVLVPEDGGWQVVVDADSIALGVRESSDVSVRLMAPEGALANDSATVHFRVRSVTDASVWDGQKLTAIVDPDVYLEIVVPVPAVFVDPSGSVEIPMIVRNEGRTESRVAITVTSSDPRPGWSVDISEGTVMLAGGEERAITLTVTAPPNALAGSRQVIEVTTVTEDCSYSSQVQVSATVMRVHGLSAVLRPMEDAVHAGEDGHFQLTIYNEGNGDESITLGTALVPTGWRVAFLVDGAGTSGLVLASKATETVDVVVSTSLDAGAGWTPAMHIVLTEVGAASHIVPFKLRVHQRYGVDLSAPSPHGAGAPDGTVTYHLVVRNEGNGEDTFVLDPGTLPGPGWEVRFHDADGTPLGSVTLEGGEARDVELRVHIPRDTDVVDAVDLVVGATSTSAETDDVRLSLTVSLPDLKIESVAYDPRRPSDGRPTQVTVRIANDGSSPAANVSVVMLVDGEEQGREDVGTLGEGSSATVEFQWASTQGRHTLTYRVSTDTMEAGYENNVLDHVKTLDGTSSPQVGLGVLLVLLAIACVTVAARIRSSRAR